jgi:UDP-galactopyranose mutase
LTLYQVFGAKDPIAAKEILEKNKIPFVNPSNLEEWCLSEIGKDLYEIFIKGYTKKQWMKDPKDLPSSIIKRIPIRTNFDDNYYNDAYQGIPIGGYTKIIDKMLYNIPRFVNTDYLKSKNKWDKLASKIVYTGPIDAFYDYCYGELEYRTTKFEHKILDIKDLQGVAQMNYTDENVPYTRIIEHKHFEFGQQDKTIITLEFPEQWNRTKIPYYPINDGKKNALYKKYRERANQEKNVIFGGRLAEYRYYDMHQIIGAALHLAKQELT